MRRRTAVAGATAVLLAGGLTGCGPEQPWENQLISVNAAGTDSGNDYSWQAVFTPDGTKVAFQSAATDLGPDDGTPRSDIYLRDLATGEVSLISANSAGTGGGNGDSTRPIFTDDGTKVVFQSMATDIGAPDGDTPERGEDIYLRDLTTGAVTTITPDVAERDDGYDAEIGDISADGTTVLFESVSGNFVADDTNESEDVFVRDVTAGTTTLISTNAAGTGPGNNASADPVLSPDGSKVAFHSFASDMNATDTNGDWDVYVTDLTTGTTTLVTANAAGTDTGDDGSFVVDFSPDGEHLLVYSAASDLGPTDTNGMTDLFLYDLATGPPTPTLVSVNAAGTDSGNGSSLRGELSPDGSKVAFYSTADDLGPTDSPHCIVSWHPPAPPVLGRCADLYVRDLVSGTTTLVTANADNTDSAEVDAFGFPVFSPDGTKIAFESRSSRFGPHDGNREPDIYVRDLAAQTTTLVSRNAANSGSADGGSRLPRFSPDGTRVVYYSDADDIVVGHDTNESLDVFVATLVSADLGVALDATPEPVGTGDDVTYTMRVTNAGPDTSAEVEATLLLPEGTTFVAADPAEGTCAAPTPAAPRVVTCALGDVPSDGSVDVTVTATVSAPAGSTLTTLARVDAATADTDSGGDAAEAISHIVA